MAMFHCLGYLTDAVSYQKSRTADTAVHRVTALSFGTLSMKAMVTITNSYLFSSKCMASASTINCCKIAAEIIKNCPEEGMY
jgi:hypothetical protein